MEKNKEIIPVTRIPMKNWIKYNQTWNGMRLPVLTARSNGGLGNAMGEYATIFALARIYNVSVVMTHRHKRDLNTIFPHLSIPLSPGKFFIFLEIFQITWNLNNVIRVQFFKLI